MRHLDSDFNFDLTSGPTLPLRFAFGETLPLSSQ